MLVIGSTALGTKQETSTHVCSAPVSPRDEHSVRHYLHAALDAELRLCQEQDKQVPRLALYKESFAGLFLAHLLLRRLRMVDLGRCGKLMFG